MSRKEFLQKPSPFYRRKEPSLPNGPGFKRKERIFNAYLRQKGELSLKEGTEIRAALKDGLLPQGTRVSLKERNYFIVRTQAALKASAESKLARMKKGAQAFPSDAFIVKEVNTILLLFKAAGEIKFGSDGRAKLPNRRVHVDKAQEKALLAGSQKLVRKIIKTGNGAIARTEKRLVAFLKAYPAVWSVAKPGGDMPQKAPASPAADTPTSRRERPAPRPAFFFRPAENRLVLRPR